RKMFDILTTLGHTIEPLVPSLFTFNVPTSPLLDLAGISFEQVHLKLLDMEYSGPLLLSHWGFSGPCVLKLSAWGAKKLFTCGYKAPFVINWLPEMKAAEIEETLHKLRAKEPHKQIGNIPPFHLPKNLWRRFLELLHINEEKRLSTLSNKEMYEIREKLTKDSYEINGKTTYKHEFVTCGG